MSQPTPETPSTSRRLLGGSRQVWLWMALALIVRLAYLMEQGSESPLFFQPLLDEQEAVESARALLAGQGFGEGPLFKAPGYSMVLAVVMFVFGEAWPWGIRLLQHLLGVLLVALAFDTARRLVPAGRARQIAGGLAGAAVALYGPLVRLEAGVGLDFPVMFFQSAMVWALVRWAVSGEAAGERRRASTAWIAVAGLPAAAAWLTRPTLTPVLPLLAVWIVFRTLRPAAVPGTSSRGVSRLPRALALGALFLALPLLVMGAILMRNARAGEMMLMPWQGGYNFYHANRSGASGRYLVQDTIPGSSAVNPTRTLTVEEYRKAVSEGRAPSPRDGKFYGAVNAWWFSLARQEITKDPANWIALMGRKVVYLLSDKEVYNYEEYDLQRSLSRILPWLPFRFGLLWPAALASLAVLPLVPRHRRPAWEVLWLYGATLLGAIALYYASGRMRMPLVFPAVVLASSGLGLLAGGTKRRPGGATIAAYLLLAAIGALISWGDWWGVRSERMWHADYGRLSNAAWRDGRPAQALEYADRAEAERPGYPTIPVLRGQALYALGRRKEAADAFRLSIQRLPGDPVAPYNLGVILDYDENQPAEAWEAYAEALRRDPGYHQAAWRGALARLRVGDIPSARQLLTPYAAVLKDAVPGSSLPPPLRIAAIAVACAGGETTEALRLMAGTSEALQREVRTELNRLGLGTCLGH